MRIARIEAFQVQWRPEDPPSARSGFLRVWSDDGRCGLGEVSPMQGGLVSLTILKHHIAPAIAGADPLDHAVIHDRLLHRLVKLGPEGALSSALAALDIALWDLKGQLLGQPIWRLLGGAWRTALPFYSSIGGNGAPRSVDEVLRIVETRLLDKPAAIKIRFDNDRVDLDSEIPDHLAKARAVRKLVGDDFPLAFDANNGDTRAAPALGRVLEELGYGGSRTRAAYHVRAMGSRAEASPRFPGEQATPGPGGDLILAACRLCTGTRQEGGSRCCARRARHRRRREFLRTRRSQRSATWRASISPEIRYTGPACELRPSRACTPSSRTRRGRWRASSVCPPRPASDSTSTKRRWRSAGWSCREAERFT